MKYYFTDDDVENEYNKIELEGEDVILIGQFIEADENEQNVYSITGDAIIEGELYHDFVTVFALAEEPDDMTARSLAQAEWDWFDYVCN